jgi:hypothetical protein
MSLRARFIPRHPEKYVGDADKIFARSSWEVFCMKYFDSRKSIVRWGSEELSIPYLSPLDNKVHNYFPDFFVEYVNADGTVLKEIIEVKPFHESDESMARSERSKAALSVNEAKWKAAAQFCEQHGLSFRVLTERTLFHQKKKPK